MFSSKQPTVGARPAKAGTPRLSFIGSEVIISGDLATDAQLHVDGRIDGNVRCAQLIQGADGIISGNIIAEEARLAGTVEGTVSAATIAVESTARILGDIAYDMISIEAGARIEGRLGRRAAPGLDDQTQPQLIATPVSFSPARANDSGLVAVSDKR
jgi:cytoskeletal protein CcmA (bactofilin family)